MINIITGMCIHKMRTKSNIKVMNKEMMKKIDAKHTSSPNSYEATRISIMDA